VRDLLEKNGFEGLIRPGIQKLLQDAAARKFEIILTEALDRLSRD
jgi:DNA invertase Pin-like site-specific DNA recombinase